MTAHKASARTEVQAAPAALVKTAPVATWRAVGAAVRGVSHERLELPCQDAQGFRVLPSGTLLVALADGAGSAEFSDQGARLAVDEALAVLAGHEDAPPYGREGWEDLLRSAFERARQLVFELAERAGESPREFASTLTCVVATADRLVVGQIGDGAVVAAEENGELFSATRLQRGEYANETHFLVQEDALEQLSLEIFERPVCALAVMSDGLIRLALKMPAQEPHTPFFQPLFRFAASLEAEEEGNGRLAAFLSSERVNARTDDDKSLVLAVRVALDQDAV